MKLKTVILCSALLLTLPVGTALAQSITEVRTEHVIMAKRATLAIKYPEQQGTSVDMIGTAIQPRARGKAEVKRADGRTRIKLELENLENPQNLGSFYTTYVLWAVAPEGQADNIGELRLNGNKSNIEVTTPNQTFGIIVTAEPHGMVKLPSPAIVAENVLRENTKGSITTSQIDYRGDSGVYYVIRDSSMVPDYATPLVVLGARRSVEIARRAGAGEYATEELRQAENKLTTLESIWVSKRSKEKVYSGEARDVMRLGELARSLSVERAELARQDAERRASDRAIARSQNDADSARTDADRAKTDADRAKTDADRARREAERAKMETEDYRAALARAENEVAAARKRAENAQTEADRAKANEEVARLEADRARLEKNEAKQETAQANLTAEQAQRDAEQAKSERDALRQRLYISIAAILDTRRETRGLIVNLSDVLFDFNKSTLKPGAREKLSKLAGILLAYPGQYQLEIEGHTDSIGSDDYNQKLSEGRAGAVRDYLSQEGIKSEKIIAVRGLGKSKPVTTNDTAEGRQMNRRVEIVIADSETLTPVGFTLKNER